MDRFFPRVFRKAAVEEFINLKQSSMSINEYALKFIQFSTFFPNIVVETRDRTSMFVSRVLDLVDKKFMTLMLTRDMDIYRLMTHDQYIYNEKFKKQRENERDRIKRYNSKQQRIGSRDRSSFYQKLFVPTPYSANVPIPSYYSHGSSAQRYPICNHCGMTPPSEYHHGMNRYIGCVQACHLLKDFLSTKRNKGKNETQSLTSSMRNQFYTLYCQPSQDLPVETKIGMLVDFYCTYLQFPALYVYYICELPWCKAWECGGE